MHIPHGFFRDTYAMSYRLLESSLSQLRVALGFRRQAINTKVTDWKQSKWFFEKLKKTQHPHFKEKITLENSSAKQLC